MCLWLFVCACSSIQNKYQTDVSPHGGNRWRFHNGKHQQYVSQSTQNAADNLRPWKRSPQLATVIIAAPLPLTWETSAYTAVARSLFFSLLLPKWTLQMRTHCWDVLEEEQHIIASHQTLYVASPRSTTTLTPERCSWRWGWSIKQIRTSRSGSGRREGGRKARETREGKRDEWREEKTMETIATDDFPPR